MAVCSGVKPAYGRGSHGVWGEENKLEDEARVMQAGLRSWESVCGGGDESRVLVLLSGTREPTGGFDHPALKSMVVGVSELV